MEQENQPPVGAAPAQPLAALSCRRISISEPAARAAFAAWLSEDWNTAEKGCRMAGDYRAALVYRTRSVIAWDRALRHFDAKREQSQ